jgi:hypothetical protein
MSIKMPDNNILKYYFNNIIIPNKTYEIKNVGVPRKINNNIVYTDLCIKFDIIYP